MKTTNELKRVGLGVALVSLFSSTAPAQDKAPFPTPPANISSVAMIASNDEPGEALVITGTVYKSDKKTPYEGLILYFYQTDATGVYNRTNRSWQEPRLRGWARTDANGRYEIRTIKPGSYPNRHEPAHIHVTMKFPGKTPVWLESFLFEGDPNLRSQDLQNAKTGRFSNIMKIERSDGKTLRCVRDFVLSPP